MQIQSMMSEYEYKIRVTGNRVKNKNKNVYDEQVRGGINM